jgi:hypothetical protein
MSSEKSDTDTAWHRRLGRRLTGASVDEGRTRGAYLNGRTAWVLGLSLAAAVILLGGVFVFHGVN